MSKKILLGGVVLVVLAGGAGGVFYFKKPKDEAPKVEALSAPVPVRVPFLAVPVVEGGTLRYYTIVSVTLETPSDSDAAAVKQDLPRVVDGMLDAFHRQPDGKPVVEQGADAAALSRRLMAALHTMPAGPHIRQVVVSTDHPVPR